MISADQPTVFPENILVRVSSRSDLTMLDRAIDTHDSSIVENRRRFCQSQDVDYADIVYQTIVYDETQTYDRILEVAHNETTRYQAGVHADALVTTTTGVGMFLPVADCIGTVMYDPIQRRLGLLHLGRHSTVAGLMTKTISYFVDQGSNPRDLTIWMSPSVKKEHYRLEYFDWADDPTWRGFVERREDGIYLDLPGFNRQRALDAGVPTQRIIESPIDTATHPEYYSHSDYFSQSQGDTTGRFAVLAMIR